MTGWSSSMPVFTRKEGYVREPEPERAPKLTEREDAWLRELLSDCAASPRLSTWEIGFTSDLRTRHLRFGRAVLISEKQMTTLRKIEEAIHAAG